MKRRRFESLTCVHACGWTAICEENKAWHLPFRATEWIELPGLPPIDDAEGQPWPEDQASDRPAASSEPIAYQGLGRQDLPIRDWANLAGKGGVRRKVNQAERLLINSIDDTSIDTGCILRSLIADIRNELGLPRPGKAAQ